MTSHLHVAQCSGERCIAVCSVPPAKRWGLRLSSLRGLLSLTRVSARPWGWALILTCLGPLHTPSPQIPGSLPITVTFSAIFKLVSKVKNVERSCHPFSFNYRSSELKSRNRLGVFILSTVTPKYRKCLKDPPMRTLCFPRQPWPLFTPRWPLKPSLSCLLWLIS